LSGRQLRFGARCWSSEDFPTAMSLPIFRRRLKTYLVQKSYSDIRLWHITYVDISSGPCSDVSYLDRFRNHWTELNWTQPRNWTTDVEIMRSRIWIKTILQCTETDQRWSRMQATKVPSAVSLYTENHKRLPLSTVCVSAFIGRYTPVQRTGTFFTLEAILRQELIRRWDSERELFTTTSYIYRPAPTPIEPTS